MIRAIGSIQLSTLPGSAHVARTSRTIRKAKHKIQPRGKYQFDAWLISKSSPHRIFLKLYVYKITIESRLIDEHQNKRKNIH